MPIDSVDALARQTAIEYGTLHGGSSMEFFKNSRIDVYSKVWEFMQSRPYVMVNSTREGVEFVQEAEGRYAFLLEAGLNDYYSTRYPCDTMRVGKNLDTSYYGIATSKSSGLQASINQALLNLQNNRVSTTIVQAAHPKVLQIPKFVNQSEIVLLLYLFAVFLTKQSDG